MIISPAQLLEQLREMVQIIAEPAKVQFQYLSTEGYPVNELYEQLYAATVTFLRTLRGE